MISLVSKRTQWMELSQQLFNNKSGFVHKFMNSYQKFYQKAVTSNNCLPLTKSIWKDQYLNASESKQVDYKRTGLKFSLILNCISLIIITNFIKMSKESAVFFFFWIITEVIKSMQLNGKRMKRSSRSTALTRCFRQTSTCCNRPWRSQSIGIVLK